jgi:hypothetical protein
MRAAYTIPTGSEGEKSRASRREVTREECQPLATGRPDLREVAQAAGYVLDLRSAAMVH